MSERVRILLLAAAAAIVFVNTLWNEFVFDDKYYIVDNGAVTAFSPKQLLQPAGNNVFRPVTIASFAFNWATGGTRTVGYHVMNVLLHAAIVILLYLVLQKLLESSAHATTLAFVTALLFAVHPIHAEAVAWIVGRSELLAAGFLLAAWLLHLSDKPIPTMLCFLLALLSKESAVTFVLLVIAGDYARGKWRPISRYGGIAGLAALYLALFWKLEGGRFGEKSISFLDNPLASFPAHLRILNGIRIAWRYIGLQAYPGTLSCDYSYNAIPLYAYWKLAAIPLVAALVVLAMWVWALRRRRSGWFLAGAIYFGSFAVTANILLPTGTIMAERLAYLPSAGFCLLFALIWVQLESRRADVAWVLLGIIVAGLSARTMVRNLDWKNNFTLFTSAVKAVPGSARVHRNLADEYVRRGELEAAFVEFRTAWRLFPDYPEVVENYGLAEARAGHAQEARKLLETAVSMTAGDSPDRAYVQTNLAWQLLRMGETENALKLLNEVIASSPDYSRAWSERAIARYKRGEAAAARSDLEMALRLDPRNEQALALISVLGPVSGQSNTR